jgi:hypothetical protein
MKRAATGTYQRATVGGETVSAFLPHPLPPKPRLELGPEVRDRLDAALLALGRLDGVSGLISDVQRFLYSYVRKEAVLSSQIEGTHSTLSDLLLFELKEAPGVPLDDVVEVSNYVRALEHGLRRLHDGFPLSNRLLREIHEVLLSRGRGAGKAPGEFRRTQNWIGGSRPGNRTSYHRRRSTWRKRWAHSNRSCTIARSARRRCSRPGSRTCSSRPSIPFSTATAASAAC